MTTIPAAPVAMPWCPMCHKAQLVQEVVYDDLRERCPRCGQVWRVDPMIHIDLRRAYYLDEHGTPYPSPEMED